jgi:hypothetical protein
VPLLRRDFRGGEAVRRRAVVDQAGGGVEMLDEVADGVVERIAAGGGSDLLSQ